MNGEILRLVDTIHRDKDIEKEIIFQGIEAALLSAVKKKLGESEDVRVVIDRITGDTKVVGEKEETLLIEDLGRIAAMTGKQVLFQKIREAERDKIYGEYEQKLGKLVTGVIQRMEGPNFIVNLGKVEGILPKSEQAPGEKFRVGERVKLLVKEVKKNTTRVKITLSRASPLLVKALFELEVPEIAERVIEIVDLVREPGYRTKLAVTTYDHNVDCVGACVGVGGSRIKNIIDELFGEKIDIVRWNESVEVLIMNGLKPAKITSMDLDYTAKKAVVYVKPDQQSLAIGKRGQNVRLASRLAKWDLDIVTVSDADIEKLRKGGAAGESEAAQAGAPPGTPPEEPSMPAADGTADEPAANGGRGPGGTSPPQVGASDAPRTSEADAATAGGDSADDTDGVGAEADLTEAGTEGLEEDEAEDGEAEDGEAEDGESGGETEDSEEEADTEPREN